MQRSVQYIEFFYSVAKLKRPWKDHEDNEISVYDWLHVTFLLIQTYISIIHSRQCLVCDYV